MLRLDLAITLRIEFDRDDELFAAAGVSWGIKVFDYSMVLNEPADVHCPVVEMCTRSKLSCLSWNKYRYTCSIIGYLGVLPICFNTIQAVELVASSHFAS
ncbi:hypothetical protein V6Z11_A03G069600 [Gossypium hirsutum]